MNLPYPSTSTTAAATAPDAADCSAAAKRLAHFFETLSPHSVAEVAQYYAADARFKDPFNDVRGTAAIGQIFAHMFSALEQPRFVVTGQVVQGLQCFMTWEFRFGFKRFQRGAQAVRGGSLLRFDAHGLIVEHRDYWDAAEELYEKLPWVGALMRWLKRRANS